MTALMTITVLVLVAIAIWQMTKIFELSQAKAKEGPTEVATDEDNKYNGYLMFAFLLFIYGITIFSISKYGKYILPAASSEHGVKYDDLLWATMIVIFVVQTITQALLHFFAYRYRGKRVRRPCFTRITTVWSLSGPLFP